MAYNNYYPQYYPQTYQPQNQTQNGIIWVGSEMEAANYLMAPNSAVALWNSNAPCIYLKQTDASGRPTMKTYDLVERSQTLPESQKDLSVEFVTRKEFDELRAKLDALTAKRTRATKEAASDGESV